MTKAEKAEFERIKHEVRLARAFSWPVGSVPEPLSADVIKKLAETAKCKDGNGIVLWYARVWLEGFTVSRGCSNGRNHSDSLGVSENRYCNFQGCGTFFRTRLEALLWVRCKMTRLVAEKLAAIDLKIEQEVAGTLETES